MKNFIQVMGIGLAGLSLSACGQDTQSIEQACLASGAGNEAYCDCMGEQADAQNLSREIRHILARSMDPELTQSERQDIADTITPAQQGELASFSMTAGLACASHLF